MQLPLATVLICILAFHSAKAATPRPADPCTAFSASPSWQAAKACLDSFPFKEERAATTIDTVKKFAQLYVFYDIAQDTPDKSFQADYDFPKALNQIEANLKNFKNDREFQEAISDAYRPMNDAHTGYEPECYRQFSYAQPFFPVARVGKDGKTKLFVQGLTAAGSTKYADLLGGEIVSINGQDAVDHVWKWAMTNVGLNKDKMTRFNRAVARMGLAANGKWRPYSGYFMLRSTLPEEPELSYVIRKTTGDNVNVTIPWDVRGPPVENARSYWSTYCSAGGETDSAKPKKAPVNLPFGLDEDARQDEFPAKLTTFTGLQEDGKKEAGASVIPTTDEAPKPAVPTIVLHGDAQAGIRDPIIQAPGMAFYTLESDDRVGVILITTFSFTSSAQQRQFRQGIADSFAKMKELGVKKLMLDLSNNGGGSGCLASEIVATMTPHLWETFPVVQNQYWKDERLSPLMKKLHDVALKQDATSFNPKYWVNALTGKNFEGEEMYNPPRNPPRVANVQNKAPYTQFIRDDCRVSEDNPLINLKHDFRPRDLAIVSNGLCGSACGRVHFHLNELDAVPAVVVGAFKGRERSASGFPATQVLDTVGVIEEIAELGLEGDADMPKPLPVQASFRFAVRQSYSRKKKNVPVEYVFWDAERKLDVSEWNALRPDRTWEQSAVLLGWVPKWNKKVVVPDV